jgi:AcrR family transcriptional regulator
VGGLLDETSIEITCIDPCDDSPKCIYRQKAHRPRRIRSVADGQLESLVSSHVMRTRVAEGPDIPTEGRTAMAAQPEPASVGGRARGGKSGTRQAKLSREGIVEGALTFLDREGWDSLTINALATQLGTKGPSLYNHVNSLEDLRRAVRIRVIDDIITMLNRVGEGRARDDAVLVMAGAYRSYAHHHPGRYSAFTRMPLGGDDPEYANATRSAAAPVIAVLSSYGLDGDEAFYAALEFWSALHGFVLLEMTGVMDEIDTDAVFADMILRLAAGMDRRTVQALTES